MIFLVDYASPSALRSTAEKSWLELHCDRARPVRFVGHVRPDFVLDVRFALRALGELLWSHDHWFSSGAFLDPVVTVHDDQVFFEAFSQDQSAYGMVILDRGLFETEGVVQTGTTNVDFTAWLWAALGEMRTRRRTTLSIGAAGIEVATQGSGARFEKKVDVPASWVRGFLEMQAAAAMPGTRVAMQPVDLLHAIRYLKKTKARVSPRALRYEFPPGEDARMVLEPFEYAVPLRGADHGRSTFYQVRTWGRRRLRLLEPLLPYATEVEAYLKGRARPSFYAVTLQPGVRFVLGLSGVGRRGFGQSRHAIDGSEQPLEPVIDSCHQRLRSKGALRVESLCAEEPDLSLADASRALTHLCRRGRATYDVTTRTFRHRELFARPMDMATEAEIFPPDKAMEQAQEMVRGGQVRVRAQRMESMVKERTYKTLEGKVTRQVTYEDWVVEGRVGREDTTIKVSTRSRIIFGQCTCAHFAEHLMNEGPCTHMIALQVKAEGALSESAKPDSAKPMAGEA